MGLFYTRMKIFHFREKLESLPITVDEIKPPIHIRIKPTNSCNHRCWYCSYRLDGMQLGKDMVVKDFIPKFKMMEILDDIAEMGVKAVLFSGGGEPFCYPFLLESVYKLSKTNVKFAALTNGSRLKGEIAEVFAFKATWLRVSIDGWNDESYSRYRGVPIGEWTKVMNNMEGFKKLGGQCYLGVCFNVDRDNATHIYETIKRLKYIGVDSVKIAPCIVSNVGKKNEEYHAPIFDRVKAEIIRVNEELADSNFEIFDSYHLQLNTFKKDYTWCPYIQICPVIGADLNVYSCHDKAYNVDEGLLGSLKDKSLREFWFSDKKRFFKINPSLVCNHHCVVDSSNKLILEYLCADRNHLDFV